MSQLEPNPPPEKEDEQKEKKKVEQKTAKKPKSRGKKYQDAKKTIDNLKQYSIPSAVKLVKKTSFSTFDGSIELHLVIKKIGLTTNVDLPYQTGKQKKIEVASNKTIEKIKKEKIDFDILLATPSMMPKLVPFARILGPRGLMPNPKNKTVVKNKEAAKKFSANSITLKTERKAPLIHTVVGKVSQKDKEIVENIKSILSAIGKKQIVKAFLTASMSPSVKIDVLKS